MTAHASVWVARSAAKQSVRLGTHSDVDYGRGVNVTTPRMNTLGVGFIAMMVSATGCTALTTTVHQPTRQVLNRTNGSPVEPNEIKMAVVRALQARRWTIEETNDDSVIAAVSAGGHSATAKITVGPGTYRIEHVKSSDGLRYDGEEIHHRYNHWIRRLDSTIFGELSSVVRTDGNDAPSPASAPATAPVDAPASIPASAEG